MMVNNMKTIKVVAAIISNGDKIFATQRGYGTYKDYWEFQISGDVIGKVLFPRLLSTLKVLYSG